MDSETRLRTAVREKLLPLAGAPPTAPPVATRPTRPRSASKRVAIEPAESVSSMEAEWDKVDRVTLASPRTRMLRSMEALLKDDQANAATSVLVEQMKAHLGANESETQSSSSGPAPRT